MSSPRQTAAFRIRPRRGRGAPQRGRGTPLGKPALVLGALLMLLAVAAVVAVAVFSVWSAAADVDSLLSGRAPGLRDRLSTVMVAAAFVILTVWFAATVARARLGTQRVMIDERGVWLTRGSRAQQGLQWDQVAAVRVADAGGTALGPAAPCLEVFAVAPTAEPGTPLGDRMVNAPPPAPGLRGRRYVLELADPADVAAMTAAIERYAATKRL